MADRRPYRPFGPQDTCVRCGQTKAEVRTSQQAKEPMPCAQEDPYSGETGQEWERHRFRWTPADQLRYDAEQEAICDDLGRMAQFFEEAS